MGAVKLSGITPRNPKQKLFVDILKRPDRPIVIGYGQAGCGKTVLSAHVGCTKLQTGEVNKIIITRPTVCVGGDDLGYLPGTLEQKLAPWMRPVYDALLLNYSPTKIKQMMDNGVVEVASLAHMRGRTFNDTWVICDEAQNTTIDQMLMVLTRIGKGSKLVVTGDPLQHDRSIVVNGLSDLLRRYHNHPHKSDMVEIVEFTSSDVERHPVIPFILELYS